MIEHVPVLLKEVINELIQSPDGIYFDCTLGTGGHADLILKKLSKKGMFYGIDQDQEAIDFSKKKLFEKKQQAVFINDNFCNLKKIFKKFSLVKADGFLFDLGFSAGQIYSKERGFSYRLNGPLDMRMNKKQKLTANEIVNDFEIDELDWILKIYGEEKFSWLIARKIIDFRKKTPIKTTFDLLKIIKSAYPPKKLSKKHPGKKTFQALRIAVNNEFSVLEKALNEASNLISPGGKIVILCYHSLEEKKIKEVYKKNNKLKFLKNKTIFPSSIEITNNPSAKSAKMLVYQLDLNEKNE